MTDTRLDAAHDRTHIEDALRPCRSCISHLFPIAFVAIGACTLETSGLSPLGGSSSNELHDAAAIESDASSSGDNDGTLDASAAEDASASPDAATDSPVVAPVDASNGDAGDPCDLDGDGHRAVGSVCNGDDCCDYDPHAFPGEKTFYEQPSACGSFDYDCDGQQSQEKGVVNCSLGFFSCSGDGFKTATPCGSTQAFDSCNWSWTTCDKQESLKTQACK